MENLGLLIYPREVSVVFAVWASQKTVRTDQLLHTVWKGRRQASKVVSHRRCLAILPQFGAPCDADELAERGSVLVRQKRCQLCSSP